LCATKCWRKITRTELIIQLLKVAIGLAFGAYFVWWSLEVLNRLAPENEEPTPAVGRMVKVHAAPVGSPSMWTLAFGQDEDRTPTHGYAEMHEAAMAAFAKSWRRQF
jgi:TRAP-type C4-dicarboxylate transport system permease small subunit